MSVRVIHGDSRDVLKTLADSSVDSVVCDPPYALVSITKRWGPGCAPPAKEGVYARATSGFMGKAWDTGETAFDPAFWTEVLRVLKPGGHLVAFGGTRTYHRLACAIEDGGFEIRDMLSWIFGSGFPKSHDVAKGIDRHNGDKREQVAVSADAPAYQRSVGNVRPWMDNPDHTRDGPSAASAASAAWQGWGTALKPALEPMCFARKPLIGTVAANVLAHGTGALNIDACRVGSDGGCAGAGAGAGARVFGDGLNGKFGEPVPGMGRWPANVIHDGSPEVLEHFPDAGGQQRAVTGEERSHRTLNAYGDFGASRTGAEPRCDSGSAARFFYSAKADAADRLESKHPTVKPVDLMAYLIKLVTPPGGLVLDPFAGSGSTGMAAMREGFDCLMIEREAEYVADIQRRLDHVHGHDTPLFAEAPAC